MYNEIKMRSLNLILALLAGSWAGVFEIDPEVMGGGAGKIRLNFKISNTVIDYDVTTSGIETHKLYADNVSFLTVDYDVQTFNWDVTDVYGREITCTTDVKSTKK